MAISRGTESKEAQSFKQYVGIAPVFIKAINPDKKQQEELFEMMSLIILQRLLLRMVLL